MKLRKNSRDYCVFLLSSPARGTWIEILMERGAKFEDLMNIWNRYTELDNNDDLSASDKATEFSAAVDEMAAKQGWSDEMTDTAKSVAEIAFACGFRNLSNFNRQFRGYVSCTPGEYRRITEGMKAAASG